MKGFALSLLTCLLLWSCSGSEVFNEEPGVDYSKASLTININGTAASTRASVTTDLTNPEHRVNKVTVYVFNTADKKLLATKAAVIDATGKIEPVTFRLNKDVVDVFAVANSEIGDIYTEADLAAKTIAYAEQDPANTSKGLAMSGLALNNSLVSGTEATPYYNEVTISLERVVAKVRVSWEVSFAPELNITSWELVHLYLLNGRTTSTAVPLTVGGALTTTGLGYGLDGILVPTYDEAYTYNSTLYMGNKTSIANWNTYTTGMVHDSVYLFENYSNLGASTLNTYKATKLILELKVTYKNGDTEYTVYPVVINGAMDNGTGSTNDLIHRNKIYSIHYAIKTLGNGTSDPEDPNKPDPTDPTKPTPEHDPVISRDLIVNLNVLDWETIINQNVVFE